MPQVKVKYELTIDATVTLKHLKFDNVEIDYNTTEKYKGKLGKPVYADNTLLINMRLVGPAGKWKLNVWCRLLDSQGNETGNWVPLNGNDKDTFSGNIKEKAGLYGHYKINWP